MMQTNSCTTRKMRISKWIWSRWILLLLVCMSTTVYGQTVTFNVRNVTVQTAISMFQRQTGYSFVFAADDVDINRVVSVHGNKVKISTIVSQILNGQNVSYTIEGKRIIVKPKHNIQERKAPVRRAPTNMKKVRGHIVDEKGVPIMGATVKINGSSEGTVSDVNGSYSLSVPLNSEITVSYVGFLSQQAKVGHKQEIDFTLHEDNKFIDEVIVIGYGTIRKADLAGSVSVMGNDAFSPQPLTVISDAFQGRMSGVQVTNTGGPGGNVKIRVRGAGSVNRSNDPLYVVDGMVREAGLEGMDPEDIASVQILKDASSTAIYGSQGANGVVIVTTKTGKANESHIIVDTNVGWGNVAKRLDLMNAYEFATAYNIAHPGAFNDTQLADFKSGRAGTDWQDEMYRTAVTQNYKLVFTGGSSKTQYYVSANYMDNEGVVIETNHTRYHFKSDITTNVTPWLNLRADIEGSLNKGKLADVQAGKSNVIWTMMNFAPVVNLYNADGSYNIRDPYCAQLKANPVAQQKENSYQFRRTNLAAHFDLQFKMLEGLTFTTSNGMSYRDIKHYAFYPKSVSTTNINSMINEDWEQWYYQSTNNLTYLGQWGRHHLTATGVWEVKHETTRFMNLNGTNLPTENVGWWNYNMASSRQGSNAYSAWSLLSAVGRVMYNYADRYALTATIRADGSSKFTNKKWGYFPSVALAWNLGNERFMQQQDAIQNAKIRVSYGLVGSQAIAPYATLATLTQTLYSFGTDTDYTGYWDGTKIAIPNLTWEKTAQFDLGVEFGILKNRVRFSFDYFNKNTRDGLLQRSMPDYDGGGTYWVNAAKVRNSGFEISVDADPVETKNLSWTTALNASNLKNKVIDLNGIPFIAGSNPATGMTPNDGVTRIEEGYPIGTFYVYRWTGLDKDGHDTYADYDGSGTVSSGDRVMMHHAMPNWILGWNNTLNYKNWALNVFFNAEFGGWKINLMRFTGCSINGDSNFITWKEAWTQSYGQSANPRYPAVNTKGNDYEAASSKWLERSDYLRFENITLSYLFPKRLTRFADVSLSINAQNLFTITGYKGQDPSGNSRIGSGSVDANDGIDMGAYPRSRSFTFGVRFTF